MSLNLKDYIYLDIPQGRVKQIARKSDGLVLWRQGYTNQVPLSTDTDGSIYNGVGYKDNTRLSSSGGVSGSAQTGSVTTGFIPFVGGDECVIRMKGAQWLGAYDAGYGHYYLSLYDKDKKFKTALSSGNYADFDHILTVTRDANGVESFVWNQSYGTTNSILEYVRNTCAYFRINGYGKGEDLIITVNEEIT